MFFKVKDKFQRTRFNLASRGILRTPPLQVRDANVTLVSQVSGRDLQMYLIAIKSLYRIIGAGRLVVLDDGSLTSRHRALLASHLQSAHICTFADVPSANTPKGGTWERLLLISSLVQDSFVIQVDSDSLTLEMIPEVLGHIATNSSFTLLGQGSFPEVEPMLDACDRAKHNGVQSMEPQAVSERVLERFPDSSKLKYVRGTSAFAGFARKSFATCDVEYFSKNMEFICGAEKWREWGSEQVTSNLIIANSPKATVLPHPKYTSHYALPSVDYTQSSFVHFMGTHRFENGCYASLARKVIRQLVSEATSELNSQKDGPRAEPDHRDLPARVSVPITRVEGTRPE